MVANEDKKGVAKEQLEQLEVVGIPKETLDFFKGDEIRARVFFEKYALRDENSNPLEKLPSEMWDRIAKALAGVESDDARRNEWAEKFGWLMQDFRFIPGGRIMFGAGAKRKATLLNCFVAGTKVTTSAGIKNIEDVKAGEMVLTHENRFMPVTHAISQMKKTELIKIRAWYDSRDIICTPEHRFLTHDRGWVKAEDLTEKDYIRVGIGNKMQGSDRHISLSGYAPSVNLKQSEDFIYTETPFQITNGYGAVSFMSKRSVVVRNRIKLDADFGRFAGLFLSEGGISLPSTLYFTFNLKETALAQEVIELTKKIFSVDGKIRTIKHGDRGWLRVEFYSNVLCSALLNMFGHYCYNKKIPEPLSFGSKEFSMALVGGVFAGDGCIHKLGVCLQLSNEELSYQIHKLLLSLGVVNGISSTPNGKLSRRMAFRININGKHYADMIQKWMSKDYAPCELVPASGSKFKLSSEALSFKIRSLCRLPVEDREVYDLSVEGDHSLVVGDIVAHNCYFIPIKEDSIEAIFDWCKESARTYSYGGGVGGDISVLRPKGAPVNNSAMRSTGAVSFMGIMSETTHAIGQAGRRGALMITISVDHPDIFDFIRVKQDTTSVKYANTSVRVTDEFMNAVESDGNFTLRFGNGVVKTVERTIKARELWNTLIKSARDWAEPGLMFWDTIKKNSPSEYNGMEILGTNPCSELPLQAYGACDLGALNLPVFVLESFTDNARMDWASLEKAVRYSVRFLDNVLDYNSDKHPLAAQKEAVGKSRRIGLGVTGLADMFAKLRLKYDTEEALQFADKLFEMIKTTAYDESTEIAKEKGPFPLFDREKHLSMPFVQRLNDGIKDKIAKNGLRNVSLLTVAPVGSGSVLAGTSSGIEPIFAFNYTRRSESLSKEYFKVYHPLVLEYMGISGLMDDTKLPEFFIPAHKINADFRVKIQGTIQKHVDSAISSTVNLPADTTTEQVGAIYMAAFKAGCKGITVYREGSRQGVLLVDEKEPVKEAEGKPESPEEKWKRPQALIGKTVKLKIQQESLYVTSNFDESTRIREVFINMGNTGSQEKSYTEAIGKLISEYLQLNGGDINVVIESLKGIRATDSISWDRGLKLYSVPDAIAKALEITLGIINFKTTPLSDHGKETGDGRQLGVSKAPDAKGEVKPAKCPSCSENMLVYESGCYTCKNCGYTKCA